MALRIMYSNIDGRKVKPLEVCHALGHEDSEAEVPQVHSYLGAAYQGHETLSQLR